MLLSCFCSDRVGIHSARSLWLGQHKRLRLTHLAAQNSSVSLLWRTEDRESLQVEPARRQSGFSQIPSSLSQKVCLYLHSLGHTVLSPLLLFFFFNRLWIFRDDYIYTLQTHTLSENSSSALVWVVIFQSWGISFFKKEKMPSDIPLENKRPGSPSRKPTLTSWNIVDVKENEV